MAMNNRQQTRINRFYQPTTQTIIAPPPSISSSGGSNSKNKGGVGSWLLTHIIQLMSFMWCAVFVLHLYYGLQRFNNSATDDTTTYYLRRPIDEELSPSPLSIYDHEAALLQLDNDKAKTTKQQQRDYQQHKFAVAKSRMDNTQAHALLTAEEELRHDEAVQQLNEVVRTDDQHLVNEASSMEALLPKQTNDNVIVGTPDNDKVAKEVKANLRKSIKKSDFSSAPPLPSDQLVLNSGFEKKLSPHWEAKFKTMSIRRDKKEKYSGKSSVLSTISVQNR